LKVIAPYTAKDSKALLKAAIKDNNPIIFLESELLYGSSEEVDDNFDEPIEIGKAKIVKEGTDVTLVSFSYMMKYTIEAAKKLEEQGISCEVIDLLTLKPLDTETVINSVKKTNRIVVIEEGWAYAGVASEIISVVIEQAFDYLDAEPKRICAKDVPLPYANNLEKMCLPSVNDIMECVKSIVP